MTVTISKMRFSEIWVETLGAPPQDGADLSFLGSDHDYETEFGSFVANPGRITRRGLTPPWPVPMGHRFWDYYLQEFVPSGSDLNRIPPNSALRALVPLRRSADFRPSAENVKLTAEEFHFPHGSALLLTGYWKGQSTLEDLLEVLINLHTGNVNLARKGGTVDQIAFSAIGTHGLEIIRERALGSGAASGDRSIECFRVVTLVSGSNVNPSQPIVDQGPVHRALQGLTNMSPTWRVDRLSHLDKADVPLRERAALGDLLFATNQGRTVWFPSSFSHSGSTQNSLSCYHRNLTLLSLQIESLVSLVSSYSNFLRSGSASPRFPNEKKCSHRAAGILGRIYGGHRKKTYRSKSAERQISRPQSRLDTINAVRDHFFMDQIV